MSHLKQSSITGKYSGNIIPSSLVFDYTALDFIPTHSSVLDLGCGTGTLCTELSRRGYRCTGVDCSADAIKAALKYANGLIGPSECSYVQGDAAELPFSPDSFDMVVCKAVFTNWPKASYRMKVVQEIRRVLKPFGVLYVADFAQAWHCEEYRARYLKFYQETGEYGLFCKARPDGRLDWYKHFSPKEITDLYIDVEFTTLRYSERLVQTKTGRTINGYVIICRSNKRSGKT